MQRGALLTAVLVFLVALAAGSAVLHQAGSIDRGERRAAALELARAAAVAVEQEFSRSLLAAGALAAMVAEGASEAELDGVARRLLVLTGSGAILQLAPDGVIRRSWPLAGNERALGLQLLEHPVHGPFARRARDERRPLVYGPFRLLQGGEALAVRVPVWIPGPAGDRFWGLVSAIVREEVLLERSHLTQLSPAGYDFQLVRVNAGAADELLHTTAPGSQPLRDPVTVELAISGQAWRLAVEPRAGWGGGVTVGLVIGAVLLALLAALLAYRVLALPGILRREVDARTAELREAHEAQRRAEEAHRQSQKLEAVGLLAGGVAHDFNNLLVGILSYSELLREEAKPGTLEEEAATTISKAATRAAELTRQLLAFARMGPRREETVDLHLVVREVVTLLSRTLDKSIRVEARLHAQPSTVRGDPGQLQQVILNLAVNARDAMPSGGTLALETSVDAAARSLVLEVSDTGVGIPPEHLERIFDPFFTTKSEGKGTGLGLSTVYGILKVHGGGVKVESTPGVGTRFRVRLPLASGPEAARDAVEAPAPRGHGRVLVVDDEEAVRRAGARVLESLGYEPVTVGGGQEALDWLAANPGPLAAVVLDLSMPGMAGAEAFRRLRALRPELRVVISSGFDRDGAAQEVLDAGAVAFVQKPYRVRDLARALAGMG
ncbi:MAG: ATP-binding protein [Anaeromyxobacter sp.]